MSCYIYFSICIQDLLVWPRLQAANQQVHIHPICMHATYLPLVRAAIFFHMFNPAIFSGAPEVTPAPGKAPEGMKVLCFEVLCYFADQALHGTAVFESAVARWTSGSSEILSRPLCRVCSDVASSLHLCSLGSSLSSGIASVHNILHSFSYSGTSLIYVFVSNILTSSFPFHWNMSKEHKDIHLWHFV